MNEREEHGKEPRGNAEDLRESGMPGGGAGRRDEVGGSGVYPASGESHPPGATIREQAGWGQGDRGAAGYEDAGSSELFFYDAELKAAEGKPKSPEKPREREDQA